MKLHNIVNGYRASIKRLSKGLKLNTQMNDTGAAEHFSQGNHDFDEDAEFHVLEKGSWVDTADRRKRESFLICKYRTLQQDGGQGGLNKEVGFFADLYGKI